MATPGNCVIPPGVGEPKEKLPIEKARQDRNGSPFPVQKGVNADSEDESIDGSFLMTLLRALSAPST